MSSLVLQLTLKAFFTGWRRFLKSTPNLHTHTHMVYIHICIYIYICAQRANSVFARFTADAKGLLHRLATLPQIDTEPPHTHMLYIHI